MGAPMATRLVDAGFDVTVHNRPRSREEPLASRGARRAASPAQAAREAQVLFLMIADTPDVQEVLFGEEGAAGTLQPGSIVVDMSTISPRTTREMAARLARTGVGFLDAPVSGGSEGAANGTLSIMLGGEARHLEQVRPLLEVLGSKITHVGPAGSGQVAKAVNQVIIAGTYQAVAEGVALALKAGIDVERTLEAVSGGAAGSWVLSNRAGNMVRNEYPLGFRTRLHHKDLGIALAAARELGVSLPVAAFVEQLETSLLARELGEEDVSNLARIAREQANLD
mgnify:FL=1